MSKSLKKIMEDADLIMNNMAYLVNRKDHSVLCIDCANLERKFCFNSDTLAVHASTIAPSQLPPYLDNFKQVVENVFDGSMF